jgi:hypothetical protein
VRRPAKKQREEQTEMGKILCRLFGHDCMTTSARRRVCLRCGLRETLRDYGNVRGWEEVSKAAVRGGSRGAPIGGVSAGER